MKQFLIALVGAVLSASYWWAVTTIGFGLFGGSYAPNSPPPSASTQTLQSFALIGVAIVVYAALSLQWRKIATRFG